jgi:GH24 family phage-related lysozyme (muramidase)
MPAPLRDVPQEAIELIKSFEGIHDGDPSTVNLDPYLDPLDIWTIGWGHAIVLAGGMLRGAVSRAAARRLYPGGITLAQAEALLRGDLVDKVRDVQRLVRVELDDGQFGALVSFAFNCGVGNLGVSTLLKKLNAGDYAAAADQFLVWNKGRKNGVLVELPGLTRRRRAERAMFLGEDWRAAAAPASRGRPAAAPRSRTGKAAGAAARRTTQRAARQAVKQTARQPAKRVAKKAAAPAAAPRAAKSARKTALRPAKGKAPR